MKYKIAAFFANRNGFDALSKVIVWSSLILMIVSGFFPVAWLQSVVYGISVAGIVYGYFRVFSRDTVSRQAENSAYLSWKRRIAQCWHQRKTHRFFRCPKCKTTLRVPRGKGKISISCRCCGEKFIKRT